MRVAGVTAREERIKRAKDNLNCFSAVSADSNTIKTFPPRKKSMILKIITEDLILTPFGRPAIGRLLMHWGFWAKLFTLQPYCLPCA